MPYPLNKSSKNFDLLWRKLWYYSKNFGTLINEGKNHGTFTKSLICYYRTIPKQWKFLNNYSYKNFDLQWQKLWYHTKNYGTLIYYGKNKELYYS